MQRYVVLLRGVNVGGKNKVPMAELRTCLEMSGFIDITTYIASGNALLSAVQPAETVQSIIEKALVSNFDLDSELIKVLALTKQDLQAVVDEKPDGFGESPERFHSDVIFLMGIDPQETMKLFRPRDGVDKVWAGKKVVYSQRLSAERTKSRLSVITQTPSYKSMTIRSWGTVVKLLELIKN